MSLYLKHRPATFGQVVGNDKVVNTLSKMVESPDKCPRVFLFHGGTGCGKTTLARIMKSALNISDDDFTEIDAAKDNGVDMVRSLISNCQYAPINGEYRMFLLDEAHRFSGAAGNALLKICEDTPKHIFFILCTTEADKVIPALRGRCQQFQLSPLNEEECVKLVTKVARKERVKLGEDIALQIAESSNGHPRNALQILEQVLNADEEERLEIAKKTIDQKNEAIELCRELMGKQNPKKIREILKSLKQQKIEPESIRRNVLGYAEAVFLNNGNEKALSILECFETPTYDMGFPRITLSCFLAIGED